MPLGEMLSQAGSNIIPSGRRAVIPEISHHLVLQLNCRQEMLPGER